MSSIYDNPEAYELAYSFRDIPGEVDFLFAACLRKLGRPPRSAVELGAGPGVHTREMARRGVKGFAVDRSRGALEYLTAKCPAIVPIEADLSSFELPAPVDLAVCPLGTFAFLPDDDAWLAGLNRAADALVPGGVLVLELVPGDSRRGEPLSWSMDDGDRSVAVTAGPTKLEDGMYVWNLTLRYRGPGGEVELTDEQRQRAVGAAEARELVVRSERFSGIELFGDWDLRRRWRQDPTVVIVAQRTP